MKPVQKTLNIRLGDHVYRALQNLSQARGVSMNKIVEEEILAAAESERRNQLKAAFARIAAQPDSEQSVEFAYEAQCEATHGTQ